jgi:hypothetical protein
MNINDILDPAKMEEIRYATDSQSDSHVTAVIFCNSHEKSRALMILLESLGYIFGDKKPTEVDNYYHEKRGTGYSIHNGRIGYSAESWYRDESDYSKSTFITL